MWLIALNLQNSSKWVNFKNFISGGFFDIWPNCATAAVAATRWMDFADFQTSCSVEQEISVLNNNMSNYELIEQMI